MSENILYEEGKTSFIIFIGHRCESEASILSAFLTTIVISHY